MNDRLLRPPIALLTTLISELDYVRLLHEAADEDELARAIGAPLRGDALGKRDAEVAVQVELVDQVAVEVVVELSAQPAREVVRTALAEAVDRHRGRALV